MYYQNKECRVVMTLPNHESVIEIQIGDEIYDPESGPYGTKLVVPTNQLTEEPIVVDDVIKECNLLRNKATDQAKREATRILSETRTEKLALDKSLKELKEKVKKFEGLEEYYDYLNGDIKWVVYEDIENCWRNGIEKLNEIMCEVTESNLAAVSFRTSIKNWSKEPHIKLKAKMYINQYSDDSGNRKLKVKGFKTFEEAKEYFINQFESMDFQIRPSHVKTCKKWDIKLDKIEKFIKEEEDRNEKTREKRKKKLEEELKNL